MSHRYEYFENSHDWWVQLGLSIARRPGSQFGVVGHGGRYAVSQVLRTFTPVGFVRSSDEPAPKGEREAFIRVSELRALLADAEREQQRRVLEAQEAEAVQKRAAGCARIEAAYASPDASTVIEGGGWAGFTLGRAIAWSWNLFDFEPQGESSHKMQLRFQLMKALEGGELPQAYGYAERARTLEARGLDPREYRRLREQLRY